jgi:hypothetical protein
VIKSRTKSDIRNFAVQFTEANVIPLEVFKETEDSLCYSALLKSKVRTGETQEPTMVVQYGAAALVYVHQRVIYLYAWSLFRDRGDVDWARTSLQDWKDDVVASNH